MADKDTALAILQAAIGLAGLLLVFAGFLLARAEQFPNERARRSTKRLAKTALIPLLAAVGCAWVAVWAAQGAYFSQKYLYLCFQIILAISALYAIIALLKA